MVARQHNTSMYAIIDCIHTLYNMFLPIVFQYKVSQTDLVNRTLWLSVWDWDRLGRNQFLGEIRLPLSTLDLTDSSEHWHTLQDKVGFLKKIPHI